MGIQTAGVIRTASTLAMEVLSSLAPIDKFIKQVAGWAATWLRRKIQWNCGAGLGGHTTILKKSTLELGKHSDCMTAIRVFNRPFEIIINELSKDNLVQVFWIKGHTGLPGNKRIEVFYVVLKKT